MFFAAMELAAVDWLSSHILAHHDVDLLAHALQIPVFPGSTPLVILSDVLSLSLDDIVAKTANELAAVWKSLYPFPMFATLAEITAVIIILNLFIALPMR